MRGWRSEPPSRTAAKLAAPTRLVQRGEGRDLSVYYCTIDVMLVMRECRYRVALCEMVEYWWRCDDARIDRE
jgi:hypothetical protein